MTIIYMDEMAEYITRKLIEQGTVVKKEDILKVLELEDDFLRLKGVIKELPNVTSKDGHFNVLCSIDSIRPYEDESPGILQMESFVVRIESNNLDEALDNVSARLKEIEKELIERFPDVYCLTSYPSIEDNYNLQIDKLSVDSLLSISPYLQAFHKHEG